MTIQHGVRLFYLCNCLRVRNAEAGLASLTCIDIRPPSPMSRQLYQDFLACCLIMEAVSHQRV
jgi:hypothetical protein